MSVVYQQSWVREFISSEFIFSDSNDSNLLIGVLQSDITDINDIFKDLGMMVHEQGDMIGKSCSLVLLVQTHVCHSPRRHESQNDTFPLNLSPPLSSSIVSCLLTQWLPPATHPLTVYLIRQHWGQRGNRWRQCPERHSAAGTGRQLPGNHPGRMATSCHRPNHNHVVKIRSIVQ